MNFQSKRKSAEVPAGSMADIAFLLLTFYMVSTVIHHEKGIAIVLPQFSDVAPQPVNKRNLFTIHVNHHDEFLVNGERRINLNGLRDEIKQFILNNVPRFQLIPGKLWFH